MMDHDFKKQAMKKFFNILMWFMLISGLFGMVGFVQIEQKNVRCTGIDIKITRGDTNVFISVPEINKMVYHLSGDTVIGKPMNQLSIDRIRTTLRQNPYALKVTVYATVDGRIKIDIVQRTPIIRIINDKDLSFYVSSDGMMMPMSDASISHVPVATGNISGSYEPSHSLRAVISDSSDMAATLTVLQQLFILGEYLAQDDFFRAQISQIYVNALGEFELVPNVGNQLILFGDINNVAGKFENLLAFYKEGMKKVGWAHYKTLNIKYKNQVICSKT
jgi:cell division protein FtsQ